MARIGGPGIGHEEHESVNIRRIDNGYIVSRSKSSPGGYESSETFSKTPPGSQMGKPMRNCDTTGFCKETMGRDINEAINGKAFE